MTLILIDYKIRILSEKSCYKYIHKYEFLLYKYVIYLYVKINKKIFLTIFKTSKY